MLCFLFARRVPRCVLTPLFVPLAQDFANERQASLQQWISIVVARPPLWCDPLRLFLGLADSRPPSRGATPFRHSDESDDGGMGSGYGHGMAPPTPQVSGPTSAVAAELRWIVSRAQQPSVGVLTEGTGFFRASTLVRWLLVQALATSREQAVPLCEAMRRQGLIHPVGDPVPFTDGSALYRFVTPSVN